MRTGRARASLWRFGSAALFCGLPLVLLGLTATNITSATQSFESADRKRATTALIVAQLEKHRARATKPVDTAPLYLTSTSDTLARAEIQDRANKLAAQAGARLAEVQLTATPEEEASGTVAIQLSLDIDNKGLLDLLYAVESGLPLLTVTSLDVGQGTKGGDADQAGDAPLHVDLTVRAHWRKNSG